MVKVLVDIDEKHLKMLKEAQIAAEKGFMTDVSFDIILNATFDHYMDLRAETEMYLKDLGVLPKDIEDEVDESMAKAVREGTIHS